MIGRFINNIWPLKEFLNYIFKKTLGDYILNDLDLNKIEIEISNNTAISLTKLQLNTQEINRKHLQNSPIKMLEGTISKLDLIISGSKIEFSVSDVFILLMPVINVDRLNSIKSKKGKIIGTNTNNVESSIISNLLNSAMSNLEVNVRNVCIKILTYEVFNNFQENPTISIYISRISYYRASSEKNEKEKPFIIDKKFSIDKICIKANKNITNDEEKFFHACNINDEKLIFNFFCDNSSILAANPYEENFLNIETTEGKQTDLCVSVQFSRVEIILNQIQLQIITNFVYLCKEIFKKIESAHIHKPNDEENSAELVDSHNVNKSFNGINIFNYKISSFEVKANFEMLNMIVYENHNALEIPKLWSCYDVNYSKCLKTLESYEAHFAYAEDNFFIFNVSTIRISFNHMKQLEGSVSSIRFKYIEFKSKVMKTTYRSPIKFINSSKVSNLKSIYQSARSSDSIYQSVASNRSSNIIFESALESDMILIEKFNKLLEFNYMYSSFPLIEIRPKSKTEMWAISILSRLDEVKGYVELKVSEVTIEFHPVYLFKLMRLIYPNVLLINEILFYNKHDDESNTTDYTEDIKDTENICPSNEITIPNKRKESFNKRQKKFQLFLSIENVEVELLNFPSNGSGTLNKYFENYFLNNIQITKGEKFIHKLNPKSDMAIEKSQSKLSVRLSAIKCLHTNRRKFSSIDIGTKFQTTLVDMGEISLYFNRNLIVNFKHNEMSVIEIKPKKVEFVTGLYAPIKTESNTNHSISNFTNILNDIDAIYNKNKMRLRQNLIKIKIVEYSNTKQIDISRHISETAAHTYKLHNMKLPKEVEYKNNQEDLYIKKHFSVNFKESINIISDISSFKSIMSYVDELMFSMNIFKIFALDISKENNRLRNKIYSQYKIKLNTDVVDTNSVINFLSLNAEFTNTIIKLRSLNGGEIVRFTVSNLLVGLINFREDNEILLSIKNVLMLLNKNPTKDQKEMNQTSILLSNRTGDVFSEIEENMKEYSPLIYKGRLSDNPNMINLKIELKEIQTSPIDKKDHEDFTDWLTGNQLHMNNMTAKTFLELHDIVICPILTKYKLMLPLVGELKDLQEAHKKFLLVPLCRTRNVDLDLDIHVHKTLLDIIDTNIRMLLYLNKINFSKSNFNSTISLIRFECHLLQDLRFQLADKIFLNRLYDIGMENSFIKSLGFVEIANFEKIQLRLQKVPKRSVDNIDNNFYTEISIDLSAIEFNFCKDSFNAFRTILENIVKKFMELNVKKEDGRDFNKVENANRRNSVNSEIKFIENYLNEKDAVIIEKDDSDNEDSLRLGNLVLSEDVDIDARIIRKERKNSSFDFIVRENEEEEIKVQVILQSFRFFLFKGKDFDFTNDNGAKYMFMKGTNSKSTQMFQSVIESAELNKFEIIDNYYNETNRHSTSQTFVKEIFTRPRRKIRDYDNHLGVNLQNLAFSCLFYNQCERQFSVTLSIERLDVDDYVSLSKYKKMISKYEYDNSDFLINLTADMMKTRVNTDENKFEDSEMFIDIKISPINVLIDQCTLIFLLDFFNVKLVKQSESSLDLEPTRSNHTMHQEETLTMKDVNTLNPNRETGPPSTSNKNLNTHNTKLIFIRRLKVSEFFINFSYNSHTISITELKNKQYLELLNISNITDFRIILKSFEFSGCKTINDVIGLIIIYWKDDITKNQIFSALIQSVSVIRPFMTVIEGFIDIFKQPWIYYKTEKSLKDGVTKGFKNFFLSFTSQSLFLGEKVFKVVKNYLGAHESDSTLNKNSYYKKFLYYINDQKRKYDEYYLKK